jgi:hypothetical protein
MGLATKLGIAALGVAVLATIIRVVAAPEAAPIPVATTPEGPASAEPAAPDPVNAPPGPTTPSPQPGAPVPDPGVLPTRSWPEPSSFVHRAEAGAAPSSFPMKGAQSLGPELRLLTEAQRTLQSDPAKALGLCDEHAKRFPASRFAQERDTLAITALMALGRTADARKRADAFKVAYPDSPNIPGIDSILSSP